MKLILDNENSHSTTITVKRKEITLLLIESSILIDSSQIAKLFDKKEKTVATKVQKSKLEKYETENIKLLKNYGLMHPDAVKPRPFYDLRQMLEGPAYYYFKQTDEGIPLMRTFGRPSRINRSSFLRLWQVKHL